MAQQFIRKATLVIGTGNQALDLSALQFQFSVKASTIRTPKRVQLRIYNLKKETSQKVVTIGASVILSAGYSGNFGTIFSGQIVQVRIGRENATDTFLDISAADSDYTYNQAIVNFSVSKGSSVIGRLGQLANAGGVKLGTTALPSIPAQLQRGRVYFGLLRDHMSSLCGTIGADWTLNNGKLEVVAQNGYRPGQIPLVTAATGMIGVPEQTPEGIQVKTLLNPFLDINGLVQLDNASIQQYQFPLGLSETAKAALVPPISRDGKYKVLFLEHIGDTRGQEWYSELVCYSGFSMGQLTYLPTQRKGY
ncbi:MAG: hypothetical protein VST70_01700 [Nitrospirota bacterium]|nr:hypothetical protein [Nitrospirota bacterium]